MIASETPLSPVDRAGDLRASEPSSCPGCGGERLRALGAIPASDEFAGRRLEAPMPGGTLHACDVCSLLFRLPRPPKSQLDALYRAGRLDHWQRPPAERPDWLAALRAVRTLPPGSRVLDVGCFDGGLLDHLGKDYQRFGVEIHAEAAQKAEGRGISIVAQDLDQLPADTRFEAVLAIDVIEHVLDPLRFLDALARATVDAGLIVISTGNAESHTFRWMGSRYWYCTLPEHVSFIGPRWCRWASQRAGLELESLELFSHTPGSAATRLGEFSKNALYRLFPQAARWTRRVGGGAKDVQTHPVLADHPPGWGSARDHFLVRLRKAHP